MLSFEFSKKKRKGPKRKTKRFFVFCFLFFVFRRRWPRPSKATRARKTADDERTTRMIADYGENRLPCNVGDWKGIGAASQKGLAARGITEPVQLLGHSLVAKMNPVAFEALLCAGWRGIKSPEKTGS